MWNQIDLLVKYGEQLRLQLESDANRYRLARTVTTGWRHRLATRLRQWAKRLERGCTQRPKARPERG